MERRNMLPTGEEYEIVLSTQQIKDGVNRIIREIIVDYVDTEPPILLTVLNGGLQFGAALSAGLDEADFWQYQDTIKVSRYREDGVSGETFITSETTLDLSGKNIIVVEDLVDKGGTLNSLNKYLKSKNPKSIKYCVLILKKKHKRLNFKINYKILDNVDPGWLVGFGMDSNGFGRGYQFVARKLK
jgi:hypoxanthine phosphoribosyltransferase